MLKRFGSGLCIGLSKSGATVVRTSGWLRTTSEILAEWAGSEEESASPENVIDKLAVLLKDMDCQGMPAKVVLSDSWVRRWMVVPPRNATSIADCQAAASARFQALFGDVMTDWHLAADWNARLPFLACAIPKSLLTALQKVAAEHRLILQQVAPQFVVAWNRWRKDIHAGAWFGVLHHKVLTYAVVGHNGLEAVRDVALPEEAMHDQHRIPEILEREALRLNVPEPLEIRLCGQIPSHWVMQKIKKITFVRLDQSQLTQAHLPAGTLLSSSVSSACTGMYP